MLSEERAAQTRCSFAVEASLLAPISRPGTTARNRDAYHKIPHLFPDNVACPRERKYYCVYILGNFSDTLYIGFSGNLHRRIFQHKFHHFEGFTNRYEVVRLLNWESYDEVHKALAREKQLKGWTRAKKIALIVRRNPQWLDLAKEWYPWMKTDKGRDASTSR